MSWHEVDVGWYALSYLPLLSRTDVLTRSLSLLGFAPVGLGRSLSLAAEDR